MVLHVLLGIHPLIMELMLKPLRLWGIVITTGGRAVGRVGRRAFRNSALTKNLTDEFCLFFTDMTYVPEQFIPYIFFGTKQ